MKKKFCLAAVGAISLLLAGCGETVEEKCTVTFYVDKKIYKTLEVEKNTAITKARVEDPVKANYVFDGWYTSNDEKWFLDTDLVTYDNMLLYAKFVAEPDTYDINYYVGDQLVRTEQKDKKDTYQAYQYKASGDQTFLGWSFGKEDADTSFYIEKELDYAFVESHVTDKTLNLYARVKDNAQVKDVNISVFGRYISEDNAKAVFASYYDWTRDQKAPVDKINYTYFDDSTHHAVSDMAKGAIEDHGDVIYPSGKNMRSTINGMTELGVTLGDDDQKAIGVSVFGQTDRYVTKLNSDEMTLSFYEYITTEAAKALMDPTYVPENPDVDPKPEEPNPEDPNVVTELKIGVWGRYVTDDNMRAFVDGYTAAYTEENGAAPDVKYTYFDDASYHSVDTFVPEVVNKGYDILLPVGGNIVEKLAASNVTISAEDDVKAFERMFYGAEGRSIAKLNNDEITTHFYQWVDSDAAKKLMDPTYVPVEPVDPSVAELNLAVWGRYVSEENITAFIEGFTAAYTEEKGVAPDVKYIYFDDASYHSVDTFVPEVVNKGYDILLPVGGNIVEKLAASNVTISAEDDVKAFERTFYGEAGRSVAKLNNDEITLAFYDWIDTDAAKNLMNPPAEPEETPEEKELVIAVYGKFITEENFNIIKDDFIAYAASENITYEKITPVYIAGDLNNAGYSVEVLKIANPDILFPIGKASIPDITPVVKTPIDPAYTVFGQTARYIGTLNGDRLTNAFYTYILSERCGTLMTPKA